MKINVDINKTLDCLSNQETCSIQELSQTTRSRQRHLR